MEYSSVDCSYELSLEFWELNQVHAYSKNLQIRFSRKRSFVWQNISLDLSFNSIRAKPALYHNFSYTLYIEFRGRDRLFARVQRAFLLAVL